MAQLIWLHVTETGLGRVRLDSGREGEETKAGPGPR